MNEGHDSDPREPFQIAQEAIRRTPRSKDLRERSDR